MDYSIKISHTEIFILSYIVTQGSGDKRQLAPNSAYYSFFFVGFASVSCRSCVFFRLSLLFPLFFLDFGFVVCQFCPLLLFVFGYFFHVFTLDFPVP